MMGPRAFERLTNNWVYGGALAGGVLLLLTPLIHSALSMHALLTYLALPLYMLHQYEEHDDDRFRRFIGDQAGSPEALSRADVFWVNIVGVWAVLIGILWMTVLLHPGWSLVAGWLVLINGLIHVAQGLFLQRYNPGLVTAVLFFLPLGVGIIGTAWFHATPAQHIAAPVLVLGLHAAILFRVRQNLQRHRP